MKHIEVGPYADDPKREREAPVNERERFDAILKQSKDDEGVSFTRADGKIWIKSSTGETLFFQDEDALQKVEEGREFLRKLFELEGKKTDERHEKQRHKEERSPLVRRFGYGEEEGRGQ